MGTTVPLGTVIKNFLEVDMIVALNATESFSVK